MVQGLGLRASERVRRAHHPKALEAVRVLLDYTFERSPKEEYVEASGAFGFKV